MNYFYIGLLKKSELGLTEIQANKKTNYRRVEIGPGDLEFNGDCLINIVDFTFPLSKQNWGFITHFGIWDSLKKGNLLATGNLIKEKIVNKNSIVQFSIGNIEIPLETIGIKIEDIK